MTAARLVHVGSAVVDYVYRIEALPASGGERVATDYARAVGGGFNMMVAASRTGLRVIFAGQHGTGPDGDFLRAELERENIERLAAPHPNLDSGNCVVLITADAERTFVSWPGAEGIATAEDMTAITLRPQDWIFASGYTLSYPGSRIAIAEWLERLPEGIPLVFDPTPVVDQIPKHILSRVLARTTWLSCNEIEAGVIAGDGTPERVCGRLFEEHCPNAQGIVLRAGAVGAYLRLADGTFAEVPGFKVKAVDTNGAGDTHIGSFVSAMARGVEPIEAALYANAAAAISVTRHGGASAPTHPEIENFLADRSDHTIERAASLKSS